MVARTVEAQLVLTGKDAGASKAVADVVKQIEELAKVERVTKPLEKLAKDLIQVEQATKAVDATLSARKGVEAAAKHLQQLDKAAEGTRKALGDAKAAAVAFEGVKVKRGSEIAQQMRDATKAVREAEKAHAGVSRQIREATRAVEQQNYALRQAESAAKAAGAPLNALEREQQRLATVYDHTTAAMQRQVRVEGEAARAAQHHAREQAEAAKHMRQHGVIGAAGALATGAVSIHGATHTIGHAIRAGSEVQGVRVDMQKAGIGEAERRHIEDESLRLATRYKNVTQAGVMELWKEMRSVMTDPHEVDHVIDPMIRAKSLLDARDKTGRASEDLGMLVKGAEAIGAAKDPKRLSHLIDGYVKAIQVMGRTITPESVYDFDKYSKVSGARLSDRFLLTTAQSLTQELKGSTAGLGVQAFYKQISGGMQNLHTAAREFANVGLIDPKNLDKLKNGEVKGVKKGVLHAVKGDTLAATDPDKWVYSVLLPALESHGIKSEGDQLAWVQKAFPNSNASATIAKLIQQRESFEAHAKMYGNATGLKGVDLNRDDPTATLGEITKSLETLAGVVTSPVMKDAAHGLDTLAGWISGFSVKLEEFNKAHPTIAKAEGPVAAAAAIAGSGGASLAVWKAFNGGFGLKTSAVALDHSAAMLDAAAVRLGAGGSLPGGGIPNAAKKLPLLVGAGLPIGVAAAIGLGVYGAAGRDQPEETVRLRERLVELNKELDRRGEAVGRAEMGGGDVGAAKARLEQTQREIDEIKAKLSAVGEQGAAAAPALNDTAQALGNLKRSADDATVHLQSYGGGGAGGAGAGSGEGGSLIHKASLDTGGSVRMSDAPNVRLAGRIIGEECVALAKAAVGDGGSVRTWRRGDAASAGLLKPGTPVATFLNPDGSTSERYAGGGTGTRGAGRDHAGVLQRYIRDEHGNPIGMVLAEQYRGSGGVHSKAYYFGRGRGEYNASNYHAIRGPRGEYLGGDRNPMSGRPEMPEGRLPPGGGMGGARFQDAAMMERMERFADRLDEISLRSHHVVEFVPPNQGSLRTKSMRVHGTGPVKPNVGISMPDAEGGRWV